MRFKVLPPAPESPGRLESIWRALPLVPDPEASCCQRLMREAGVPSQDEAKEWLTFCRALGLANKSERGYARVRDGYDPDAIAERFRDGVYAADETLAVLADSDSPLDTETIFDRLRDRVPAWERARSADWETQWRRRVERIVEWARLFGFIVRTDDGYRRT